MARVLHIDPLAGASGDMLLAMLVDLGFAPALLAALPARLGLDGVTVTCTRTMRGAIDAARVVVTVRGYVEGARSGDPHRHGAHAHEHDHKHDHDQNHDHDHSHVHGPARTLADVRAVLRAADLPQRARDLATATFERLFAAEARVHGRAIEEVHLHEAGADDALVDIVGVCLGLVELEIDEVTCSAPVPLGGGVVRSAHGVLPVPAPAVAELLRGISVTGGPVNREMVTPTGAALLAAIVTRFAPLPALTIHATGFGAGSKDDPHLTNVVRGVVGEQESGPREREVAVLETAIDDMLPQDVPVVIDRLLGAGARDALMIPAQMKKGRPAFRFEVVCDPADADRLARLLLHETPTLGVRVRTARRLEWDRDLVAVDTPWGPVRVKRAMDSGGRTVRSQPEFDDCRDVADRTGQSVDVVRQAARAGAAAAPTTTAATAAPGTAKNRDAKRRERGGIVMEEGLISIDEFGKLELRTAKVIGCERHPNADKLLVLQVDLGAEQRQIVAGIASRYAPEQLIGKTIVVVANLAPAKLRGLESQGMLLAATGPDGLPTVLSVDGDMPPGAKVS